MKIGDLVKYCGPPYRVEMNEVGFVLKVNNEGGTIKVLHGGETKWWVTSGCEVVNGR